MNDAKKGFLWGFERLVVWVVGYKLKKWQCCHCHFLIIYCTNLSLEVNLIDVVHFGVLGRVYTEVQHFGAGRSHFQT